MMLSPSTQSGLSFNNRIAHALSFAKRYKEILSDLQVKSYHDIVPLHLGIRDNQVVDGADHGDCEEHNAKGKGGGHGKLI